MKKQFPHFLKIVTLDNSPSIRFDVIVRFTKLLSEVLNFSYQLVYSVDGQLGQHLGGSNWTGIIGMLNRSECDMSVDTIVVTESRNEAVLFSYPYLLADMTFVTNKPEPKPKSFAIIQPFSTNVWLGLIASFFSVSFLFYKASGKKYSDTLLMLFGSLFTQPCDYKLRKLSSKLLTLSWMIGTFILIASYKATLHSCLSFPSYIGVRTVKELSDAATQNTYKCVTRKGSFIVNYLLNSPEKSVKNIGHCLRKHNSQYMRAHEFLQSGKGAYISIRPFIMHLQEKYVISPDALAFTLISIALRKDFCCKAMLDSVLRRMTEMGLYEKIVQETIFQAVLKERSRVSDKEHLKSIVLDDLKEAFFFLIMGNILGLLCFVIEYYFNKWKHML